MGWRSRRNEGAFKKAKRTRRRNGNAGSERQRYVLRETEWRRERVASVDNDTRKPFRWSPFNSLKRPAGGGVIDAGKRRSLQCMFCSFSHLQLSFLLEKEWPIHSKKMRNVPSEWLTAPTGHRRNNKTNLSEYLVEHFFVLRRTFLSLIWETVSCKILRPWGFALKFAENYRAASWWHRWNTVMMCYRWTGSYQLRCCRR